MANITGAFPVHAVDFEINTAPGAGAGTYVCIKDLESAKITIDTTVETWTPLDQGGWQRALATAKSYTIACSGKRCIGDPGNDFIASKQMAIGQECSTDFKVTFPDGSVFSGGVVIGVSECGTGDSTNVGPLVFDLTSDGKPTYTPATA